MDSSLTRNSQDQAGVPSTEAELEAGRKAFASLSGDSGASYQKLEAFSYSVAHELRAPLRFANYIANLLLTNHGKTMPYEAVQQIEMILESTRQMGDLIEDLFVFSKESCRPLEIETINLTELAREAWKTLEPEHTGRNVELAIEPLPDCQADRQLLKLVLTNLLSNALKFTRSTPNPRIQVGATYLADKPVYYVSDNGTGFAMENADALFAPFQRLHQPGEFEGMGLGLTIVKRIIDRHGGEVWASGKPRVGATFFFRIGESNE